MRPRAVSAEQLVSGLAEMIAARRPGQWLRVAVDGAPPARPDALADALVDPLRVHGRPVLRVAASGYLRPASLRYERGRTDPDAFYEDWLDASGLAREVLAPLAAGGPGRVLPSLWDARADRASRAEYVGVPPGGVLLVDGTLLLGRSLAFDLTVHLWLSPAALERQTAPADRWTLPAYSRYAADAAPTDVADWVVRMDHPAHPALLREPAAPAWRRPR